jgi:cell wall-associated NlpC family hydrolase
LEKSEIYPYNDFIFLSDFDRNSIYESFEKRKLLVERLNDWMGVRYRLPGRSRQGVDCSNFASIITQEVLNMQIPAGSATQATLFPRIDKKEDLQFGDFVFFTGRNRKSKRIGHVGIYIGNGLFAHSSTSRGVIYSHISEGYYEQRYRFGGRIMRTDLALLSKDFRNIKWIWC